jgi:hypothetical protein
MFCWPCIAVYQYSETNVMPFLFNFLTIKGLYMFWASLTHPRSGFGGLGVSMLASGTQDRGFAPDRSRRIFPAGKIHSMPSFGGEIICPMTQLWGMRKNPALFVNFEIAGQIPLVPSFASRVRCVSGWYTAPLVVKEGSFRGEGTIDCASRGAEETPKKRPFPFYSSSGDTASLHSWCSQLK